MEIPTTIGRYEILERVGRGGMGVLYRGRDPVLDREVAIKVLLADFWADEQVRPRFFQEARAAAKLQHRNIVTIHEFGEESGTPFIVMEFLKGQDLARRMQSGPPLSLQQKVAVVRELCEGLDFAHQQGVVHRDVKPANIWLQLDGSVKLLDFGIAKVAMSSLTRDGNVLGSASYMSPEQVAGKPVDQRADIFSVGVVLYELLAGRKPFEGESPTAVLMKIMTEPPVPIRTFAPDLPDAMVAVVECALEKEPAKRFPRARQLGAQLARALPAPPVAAAAVPPRAAARAAPPRMAPAAARAAGESAPPRPGSPGQMVALARPVSTRRLGPLVVAAGVVAAAALIAVGSGTLGSVPTWAEQPAGALKTYWARARDGLTSLINRATGGDAAAGRAPAAVPAARSNAQEPVSPARPPRAKPTPRSAEAASSVEILIAGDYPFEVYDGQSLLSPASTTHRIETQARAVHLRALEYFLDLSVPVGAPAGGQAEIAAPALGHLTVVSALRGCAALVDSRPAGTLPIEARAVAAGAHQIELQCPDGVARRHQTMIEAGKTTHVEFR